MSTIHILPIDNLVIHQITSPPIKQKIGATNRDASPEIWEKANTLVKDFYKWGRDTGLRPYDALPHFTGLDLDVAARGFQLVIQDSERQAKECVKPNHIEKHAKDTVVLSVLYGVYLRTKFNEQK